MLVGTSTVTVSTFLRRLPEWRYFRAAHSVATVLLIFRGVVLLRNDWAVVDGKWKNKSPPAHLDMMAEMGWKRKQKEAKAAWEVRPRS